MVFIAINYFYLNVMIFVYLLFSLKGKKILDHIFEVGLER